MCNFFTYMYCCQDKIRVTYVPHLSCLKKEERKNFVLNYTIWFKLSKDIDIIEQHLQAKHFTIRKTEHFSYFNNFLRIKFFFNETKSLHIFYQKRIFKSIISYEYM